MKYHNSQASIICTILLKGNNTLHWAILGGRTGMASWLLTQVFGTSCLLESTDPALKGGKKALVQKNASGQTPRDLLKSNPDLRARLAPSAKRELQQSSRPRVASPLVRQGVMLATPLVILWAIGTILELDYGIYSKLGLTFLLSTCLNGTVMFAYDDRLAVW